MARVVCVGGDNITLAQKVEVIKTNQSEKKRHIDKVLQKQCERQRCKQLDTNRRAFMLGQLNILKELGYKSSVIAKYLDKPTMYAYYRFTQWCKCRNIQPYDDAYIYIEMIKTMGFLINHTIYKLSHSKDINKWKITRDNAETILVDKIGMYKRFDAFALSGTRYDA